MWPARARNYWGRFDATSIVARFISATGARWHYCMSSNVGCHSLCAALASNTPALRHSNHGRLRFLCGASAGSGVELSSGVWFRQAEYIRDGAR